MDGVLTQARDESSSPWPSRLIPPKLCFDPLHQDLGPLTATERQKMQPNVLEGYRLSPQQRHLWMLLQLGWSVAFQTKCAVSIKGALDSGRLKTALENVVTRHEILRTTFQSLPGMIIPMQVIRDTGDLVWQEDEQ